MSDKKVCNCCGKELDLFDEQQNFYIHTQLEYGSRYDGEVIHYHLCCDCIDRLIEESAVSPIEK